jgi:hypothetical protein
MAVLRPTDEHPVRQRDEALRIARARLRKLNARDER